MPPIPPGIPPPMSMPPFSSFGSSAIATSVVRRIEAIEAAVDTARLELRQAQSAVGSARRAVTIAKGRLTALGGSPGGGNALPIKSPIDGIVTDREATTGESIRPESELFKILNPSVVWVEGDVFEKDLSKVRVGMPARITTDSVPGQTFGGKVSYLAASVNPETRAVRVRVAVPNATGTLRPGMFVRVLFVGAERAQTVALPDEAVQKDGAMTIVYVKEGDTYLRREVSVGESVMGHTVIRSGLKPGEVVVTTGAYQLKAIGKA